MLREISSGRPRGGKLVNFFRQLGSDPEELDAQDLQQDVTRSGAVSVSHCQRGQQVVVTGRLRSVVYTPRENVATLEAELFDGSGAIRLVWLGRRRIAGVEPGRFLMAKGRLAEQDGELVLYNPWYELRPAGHE